MDVIVDGYDVVGAWSADRSGITGLGRLSVEPLLISNDALKAAGWRRGAGDRCFGSAQGGPHPRGSWCCGGVCV